MLQLELGCLTLNISPLEEALDKAVFFPLFCTIFTPSL